MQSVYSSTYHGVGVEAFLNGFDGSWERLIAKRILADYEKGISEAEVLMDAQFSAGIKSKAHAASNVAKLIYTSTIQPHEELTRSIGDI